ncbi:MAG: hypothetical protein COU07_01795 [Candidatus Harrisonbacteria bacterium CG10_big_fil_rev_8_21_14_0_10_40_38]|uniref:Recombinase domain-containing protein n=1 Tax=Candidatus Harrisonbacteria bacterium CG10_big_fil_rev_8_21_14_0_10_40_38 TaxID=1974583 RepID=A0A2H0UT69_9BACT|nr:MAG: hypothetical protein COU07_01795 [Candidatus Harrisonbacteria bacterium CG10_big_fil_rev_8_21_14_0_10_40_38]
MTNDNVQLKYGNYNRKSSEAKERQVLSIGSQIDWAKETTEKYKIRIAKTYKEEKSAETPYLRPEFDQMVKDVRTGVINALVEWKLDRLARNPEEAGIILGLLKRGDLKHIITSDREYRPEDNAIISYVDFGMADQYVRDLSKNVKRGLKAKLQMGWYPSRAPLGYLNSERSEDKGRNWILKDPQRFDMVKQMWQMMLTGNYTPPQILEIVNKDWKLKTRPTKKYAGLKPLSRSNIYKIFTNPFYYGYFEYGKGADRQLYKGNHEPMITEEEFDRVQKILGRKGKPRPKEHRFAFTGLMRCANCGAMVTAEEKVKRQKNGNVHTYIYYHCTKRIDTKCPEKMVELAELNQQIDAAIGEFAISERFKDWAIQYLHELRKEEAQSHQSVFENKQKVLSDVTRRLEALLVKYTSPENQGGQLITDTEYQALKTNLLKERTNLEREVQAQGKAIEDWVELSERVYNFARYARLWFEKGDREVKRAIFACLGSHLYLTGQKVAITRHKVFDMIFEALPNVEKELAAVRTSENVDVKRQIAVLAATSPSLRRG